MTPKLLAPRCSTAAYPPSIHMSIARGVCTEERGERTDMVTGINQEGYRRYRYQSRGCGATNPDEATRERQDRSPSHPTSPPMDLTTLYPDSHPRMTTLSPPMYLHIRDLRPIYFTQLIILNVITPSIPTPPRRHP